MQANTDSLTKAQGVDSVYVHEDWQTTAIMKLVSGIITDNEFDSLVGFYQKIEEQEYPAAKNIQYNMHTAFDALRAETFPDPAMYATLVQTWRNVGNPSINFYKIWARPESIIPYPGAITRITNDMYLADLVGIGGFFEESHVAKMEEGSVVKKIDWDTAYFYKWAIVDDKPAMTPDYLTSLQNPYRQVYQEIYNPVKHNTLYIKNLQWLRIVLFQLLNEAGHSEQMMQEGWLSYSEWYVWDVIATFFKSLNKKFLQQNPAALSKIMRDELYSNNPNFNEHLMHVKKSGSANDAYTLGRSWVLAEGFVSSYAASIDYKNAEQIKRLTSFYDGYLGTYKDPIKKVVYELYAKQNQRYVRYMVMREKKNPVNAMMKQFWTHDSTGRSLVVRLTDSLKQQNDSVRSAK